MSKKRKLVLALALACGTSAVSGQAHAETLSLLEGEANIESLVKLLPVRYAPETLSTASVISGPTAQISADQ